MPKVSAFVPLCIVRALACKFVPFVYAITVLNLLAAEDSLEVSLAALITLPTAEDTIVVGVPKDTELAEVS